jgi:hypothetical protein
MVVVNGQTFYKLGLVLSTNSAASSLSLKHGVVIFNSNAVFLAKVKVLHVVNVNLTQSLSTLCRQPLIT